VVVGAQIGPSPGRVPESAEAGLLEPPGQESPEPVEPRLLVGRPLKDEAGEGIPEPVEAAPSSIRFCGSGRCSRLRTKPAFVQGLETAAAKKGELTPALLEREEWDLFMQVFTEGHCAGHQCWHLHDPAHPAHDPAILAEVGDPLERVYRAMDRAVGRVLEGAGDARVLLFSSHGMSHFRGAWFLLPEILRRLGVTVAPERGPVRPTGLRGRLAGAARRGWGALPEGARAVLRPVHQALGPWRPAPRKERPVRDDVGRSRCFPIPAGFLLSAIRLSLAGREPRGILQPGPEADAFCRRLAEDLLEVVDADNGAPLVSRVLRMDELYQGPRRDALPDLLVEWGADTPLGTAAHGDGRGATVRATSPRIGRIEGVNSWRRTGEHVPTGFFVFAGEGVAPGRREAPIPLVDLHPTLCRLLGLPEPEVDGTALPDFGPFAP
jgi:predicted AlkP superfamily phosphohydrolase/phosphomutase